MTILEKIIAKKEKFIKAFGHDPNYIDLGKKAMGELRKYYEDFSEEELKGEKMEIKEGAMIMGMAIVEDDGRGCFSEDGMLVYYEQIDNDAPEDWENRKTWKWIEDNGSIVVINPI